MESELYDKKQKNKESTLKTKWGKNKKVYYKNKEQVDLD